MKAHCRTVTLGGERELLETVKDDRHRGWIAEEQVTLGSLIARQLAQVIGTLNLRTSAQMTASRRF
jgi:hypothetical protein